MDILIGALSSIPTSMRSSQVISVTDLRHKTKEIIDQLDQGVKYVFANNKPKAVIMSPQRYEELKDLQRRLERDADVADAKKNGKRYTNVDEFMKDLFED